MYFKASFNIFYLNGEISSLLVLLYMFFMFVSNLMAVASEMFGHSSAQMLLQQFDRLEHQIKLHMLTELNSKRLRNKILVKYRYLGAVCLQSLAVYLVMAALEKTDNRLEILFFALQAFSTIVILHIVLHTELVHFVLQSINIEIDREKFVHVTRLQGLQRIYFEVWRTVQTVNADQGWTLVTLLFVLVVGLITEVFSIFKSLRLNADPTEWIRKFFFFD